jgi:DNA repair exonuclease SbcCD ATPase subunit
MKTITLKSITLRNFRGEKERTTRFNDDATTIMGDNGLGKSRHFSAFCWLLFGKDELDRKDFNVRSLVGGEPLHRVECSVEAELSVDGDPVILKRALVEKWVKPRGQADEVFKGNETETFWNNVPISVSGYQSRVSGLISDAVFKMVTNPLYFATQLRWQEQREQLFALAGAISDAEVAVQRPEFADLLGRISGKPLADFRREIAARKKRLKDELAEVQPRIDQTQKLMPATLDFAALEAEAADLEQQLADADKAIADAAEASRQQGEARQQQQAEINALKQRLQALLFEEQRRRNEQLNAERAAMREVESRIIEAEQEAAAKQREVQRSTGELASFRAQLGSVTKRMETLRCSWERENAKEYAGSDACATCGQPLPESMKADARRLFAEAKARELDTISKLGAALKDEAQQLEVAAARLEATMEAAVEEGLDLESRVLQLKEKLAGMPAAAAARELATEDIPECAQLSEQIQALEAALSETAASASSAQLLAQKTAIAAQITTRKDKLRSRDLIAKYTEEIAHLGEHGKSLGQQIADLEREEFLLQQFSKAKVEECERRINGLFTQVTFRLFDYTIDGAESETCVPLVDGVPFDVANTAGQVNAGLDIINALSRYYAVSAPIFIDHRESVNSLIPTDSQIINLVVSSDKELIVK